MRDRRAGPGRSVLGALPWACPDIQNILGGFCPSPFCPPAVRGPVRAWPGAWSSSHSLGTRGCECVPLTNLFVSGKYLRQKRIDFQLPYDILWQWKHNQVRDKKSRGCQDWDQKETAALGESRVYTSRPGGISCCCRCVRGERICICI